MEGLRHDAAGTDRSHRRWFGVMADANPRIRDGLRPRPRLRDRAL